MLNSKALYKFFVGLLLIIILFTTYGGLFHSALAHGPDGSSRIRIDNEKIGPYNLLVVTSPQPVTTGPMEVWVRVADDESDRLLRNATVMIEATARDNGSTLTAEATHDHAGNVFDYVAQLEINDDGEWDFTIYVEDEPGQIDVTFTETVDQELNLNLLVGLAIPFVVLIVVVGIYLSRQSATATQNG